MTEGGGGREGRGEGRGGRGGKRGEGRGGREGGREGGRRRGEGKIRGETEGKEAEIKSDYLAIEVKKAQKQRAESLEVNFQTRKNKNNFIMAVSCFPTPF